MATAGDVVTRSLQLLSVAGIGRAASAEEMAGGLTALRDMLAQWEMEGVRLGAIVGVDLISTTVMPFPASHLDPIQSNLAMRLAPEYGASPSPALATLASMGMAALQAMYLQVPKLRSEIVSTYRGTRLCQVARGIAIR